MLDELSPRIGFEVELLAPRGASRRDLAEALAKEAGGDIRPLFHHDTEVSLVKDRPVFHHLSLGFEVFDFSGRQLCRLVDDVTIFSDLDAASAPASGWFRVLSDDARFLRLVERVADPSSSPVALLEPLAKLFGTEVEITPSGKFSVKDSSGASVAMVAAQPGERERVCEIITPPLEGEFTESLERLLAPARALGFAIPKEAAVHAHLDADPYRDARKLTALVNVFGVRREEVWKRLETNEHCRRLAPLPAELIDRSRGDSFGDETWPEIQTWLQGLNLTKYSDLNIRKLAVPSASQDTIEVRVLPGADNGPDITARLQIIADLLNEVSV